MTTETRTEIVLFSALAAFLAFLWWTNRANGAGSGVQGIMPAIFDPTAAPLFNLTSPNVAGTNLSYSPGDVSFGGSAFNIGGPSLGAVTPGACNCPAGTTAPVFGCNANLQAFLASNPDFMTQAIDGLSNWN